MKAPNRPGEGSSRPENPHDSEIFPGLSSSRIGRRRFLVVAGGIAATAAMAPGLAWAKRVPPLGGMGPMVLQPWSLPAQAPADPLELSRALIGAAVLAPSDWNTQPWRFEVETGSLRLVTDPARLLPRS